MHRIKERIAAFGVGCQSEQIHKVRTLPATVTSGTLSRDYFHLTLTSKPKRPVTTKKVACVPSMASIQALYKNFKDDLGELIEPTDFSVLTWLALGAALQLLSQLWLPHNLSYWLPLLYLVYRLTRTSVDCCRVYTGTFTNVFFGRWSATLPDPTDPSAITSASDGVVMFLLGARINQSVLFLHREVLSKIIRNI